ncbi:MAG TPA: metallophosphoesterase [Balneolaceae bacterium]|nr:metallophosphoesterase [Balneolaceae bacterium]
MHIGICSDSHDHVTNAENAANYFRQEETGLVIHAGDYCSPFIIGCFENLPLHGIFGNNDGYRTTIAKKFEQIGATLHGDFFSFSENNVRFAVYHGTYPEITESLIAGGKYDVVISGHTHKPSIDTIGGCMHINPGSIHGFDGDGMVALFDTSTRNVRFKELND